LQGVAGIEVEKCSWERKTMIATLIAFEKKEGKKTQEKKKEGEEERG